MTESFKHIAAEAILMMPDDCDLLTIHVSEFDDRDIVDSVNSSYQLSHEMGSKKIYQRRKMCCLYILSRMESHLDSSIHTKMTYFYTKLECEGVEAVLHWMTKNNINILLRKRCDPLLTTLLY